MLNLYFKKVLFIRDWDYFILGSQWTDMYNSNITNVVFYVVNVLQEEKNIT